jgi:hypothetical protein
VIPFERNKECQLNKINGQKTQCRGKHHQEDSRTSLAARERLDRLERPRLILLHCLIPSDDSLGLYIEPG